mgnify:CR=1 FL=1
MSTHAPDPPFWAVPDVVSGSWATRRDLARALRKLSARCITSEADDAALAEAAGLVQAASALLAGPQKTSGQAWADHSYHHDIRRYVDRGALVGLCNPVAPPLQIQHTDGVSSCTVTLDERFVGAPGLTHGGVVASIYDQMCGHAVVWSGLHALTIELSIRYVRPTPLHAPLVFSAHIERDAGATLRLVGSCTLRGTPITSCSATFKKIDRATADALFAPGQSPSDNR